MTPIRFTDRSRIETYQHCPRERWLEYHEAGRGITSAKKSLPLAVGASVHVGLEYLLRRVLAGLDPVEDLAVKAAIDDFSTYRTALALDNATEFEAYDKALREATAPAPVPTSEEELALQLAQSLGYSSVEEAREAGIDLTAVTMRRPGQGAKEYDDYLWQEQSALVEGMVRAYARRRLPALLEQYEILEVEREGTWELTATEDGPVVFMSRPDALLRDRQSNWLYVLSYKTAAQWDIRRGRDAEHDMQGLSEGVEVEKRLSAWWERIQRTGDYETRGDAEGPVISDAVLTYLRGCTSPPRISGIRYEFLLKGRRERDKDLSSRFGFDVWAQKTPLLRAYFNETRGGPTGKVCWSWDFHDDAGKASKLSWQNWKGRPVVDQGYSIRGWLDLLDQTTMTMSAFDSTIGQEPRELGWGGPAQVMGYTAEHPLDSLFLPPIVIYRTDDDLRDWYEQTESQEQDVARAVVLVASVTDDDRRRTLLNIHFPQTRRACEYPSTCKFVKICYGGEDIRRQPIESGLYKSREPHHVPEKEQATVAVLKET